jgi:hypothetical protein
MIRAGAIYNGNARTRGYGPISWVNESISHRLSSLGDSGCLYVETREIVVTRLASRQ